jgi:orotate phosphoribosyltransferase
MNLYEAFKQNNIIEKGHFVLRSGLHSDTYIRKTKIITNSYLYNEVTRLLADEVTRIFKLNEYDIITGPAVAGLCFAAPVAIELGKPLIFPEKKSKESNKMEFRPEFKKFLPNKKVIIIEDITTTGRSILETSEEIFKLGGIPIAAFCIINRNSKLKEIKGRIYSYTFPVCSLITIDIKNYTYDKCPYHIERIK